MDAPRDRHESQGQQGRRLVIGECVVGLYHGWQGEVPIGRGALERSAGTAVHWFLRLISSILWYQVRFYMLIIPVEESYRLWCVLDMAVYKQQIKSVVEKMKKKLCHAAMVGRR